MNEPLPQPASQQQAFSYVRFSSSDQAKGDSLRRQTELAEQYAQSRGMRLDTGLTFRDLGISAFSGSNRAEGALSAFIKACRSGRVAPGSALLVESLDRLSREQVRKALRLLLELIDDYSVEIHTLADRHVYGKGTDTTDLVLSLIIMSRAHEESERKSQRVGAAWRQKKAAALEKPGIAITAKVPLWIHAEKGKPLSLIKERAKVVKKIFSLALSGLGAELITQYCNERYRTFTTTGKGWHKSYIEKILRNPAAYGSYIPHKRRSKNIRVIDGEPILGFFPAVIDFVTFQAVQEARVSRYRQRRGSTSPTIRNLFAGLIRDIDYDLPMVYYWRGNELVTDSYRMKLKPHRIDYAKFEGAFLRFLSHLDWTSILDVSDVSELDQTKAEIARLSLSIHQEEEHVQKLIDLLVDTPSKALKDRLTKLESEIEQNKAARDAAEKRLEEVRRKHRDLLEPPAIHDELMSARDLETRARLREEIRRKVQLIECSFNKELKGIGKLDVWALVTFSNGAQRPIILAPNVRYAGAIDEGDLQHIGGAELLKRLKNRGKLKHRTQSRF